ncbi:hypothetical protein [Actinophytocola sp.]|uniref:hypothetical protein n=1 Tax=Actinophytocola sp. TaxID=1872138 RepID=UPI003899C425
MAAGDALLRKGQRPHEIAATVPPENLVAALVRNLAGVVGGQAAYCVGPELAVIAAWPAPTLTGVTETAREPVAEDGVVLVAGPKRWGEREQAVLRETAGWLGMAARLDRLRADRDRAEARATALRVEVRTARERFAQVRELERRRLVKAITTTTLRDLDDVRRRLRHLDESLTEATSSAQELEEVRDALDELLDEFRTVVRGVYPSILPDRGPRAALEELAATLPRPVRFDGDLGRRVGWEVESGLYHAVAAVLTVLAGSDRESAVAVDFSREDALRVLVTAPAVELSLADLRTALDHDAERLAVLGGSMRSAVTGGAAVVSIRLSERVDPVLFDSPRFGHNGLYRRVSDLVRQGVATDGPDRARWAAVAERLASPPRVAVVRAPGMPRESAVGVVVVDVEGQPDQALAEEFLADSGPRGSIDAVLCLVPPTPAFRAALRWGRQRVALSESMSLADLARTVISWSPVIAARRAIVTVRELTSVLPLDHPLRWGIDRIGAGTHEIAELDLLDDLERGDTRLLRGAGWGAVVDAVRLLGARGTDPRARLGLSADAREEQVREAADLAVRRWRAHAERPGTGGRDRAACEVLARTAEGMLSP